MRAVTAESSAEVLRLASGYDAVGIDEVQFFDDGIVDAIAALVARGARVVAAGLAQDFRGLPFGAMPTLLCVAEFVDKLEAVCHRCGGPATLTQRLVDGAPAPFDGATVQIGALDSYEARCRACYEPGSSRSKQPPDPRRSPIDEADHPRRHEHAAVRTARDFRERSKFSQP